MRLSLPSAFAPSLRLWLVSAGLVLLFVAGCALSTDRTVEDAFVCQVALPAQLAPTGEPLLVMGQTGRAHFLAVRPAGPGQAILRFDTWGVGGPDSPAFAYVPDQPVILRVRLPGVVASTRTDAPAPSAQLEVRWGATTLLAQAVAAHRVPAASLQLGINPLGGSSCGPRFAGTIRDLQGRNLVGPQPRLLPAIPGWRHFLARYPWLAPYLLPWLAALAGIGWLLRQAWRHYAPQPTAALRRHAPFLSTWLGSMIVFAWLLTGGTFALLYPDSFGNLYDAQTQSLLQGRLDVSPVAASGEAFLYHGKTYTYFGPVPALLRLPFVLAQVPDGQVTRLLLCGYFGAALALAYALLLRCWRAVPSARPHPSPGLVVGFLLNVGLGSTLLFLGSRAYVYHEAILGGIAWALAAAYATTAYLLTTRRRALALAVLFGLLALHTRPTAGIFALSLPASASLWRALFASWRTRRLVGLGEPTIVIAACALATASFCAVSYLKFDSLEGAPFQYHVQYDAARLARFEGRNFHLANVASNTEAYFLRPNLEWQPSFPWIYSQSHDFGRHPGTKMDIAEPMTALPYAMTGLCLLALLGLIAIARGTLRPLTFLWLTLLLAAAPLTLALLTAVALSHRYTGDFCPPLIVAAVIGTASFTVGGRKFLYPLLGLATAQAVLLTLALALQFQGEQTWGSPPEVTRRFATLRQLADHGRALPPAPAPASVPAAPPTPASPPPLAP